MADDLLEREDNEEEKVGKVKLANFDLAIVIHQLQKNVSVLKKKNLEQLEELEKMKNGRVEFELEIKRKLKKMEPSEKQKEIDELKEQIKTMNVIVNTVTKQSKELKEKLALSCSSSKASTGSDDSARSEVELELKWTKFKLKRISDEVDFLKDQLKIENDNVTTQKDQLAQLEVKLELQGSQLQWANKRVAQVESEKRKLQKSLNEQQKLEEENKKKVVSLEGQVRNAAVKEKFHMDRLSDREKVNKKLKEDLKKALEDKKPYQDNCTNNKVSQLESEKDKFQISLNRYKQKEKESKEKIELLESQVQNAIIKESFTNNLLKNRDEELKNLKEELRQALEDNKSYQNSFMRKLLLVSSLRKELTKAKEQLKEQEENVRIVNACINEIDINYKQETSTWKSTLAAKQERISDLRGEREKLLVFANNLQKLSQFEMSDSSSSIVNELDNLRDHISKKMVAMPVMAKEKDDPKTTVEPARKRKMSTSNDNPSQNEVSLQIGSHKKPKVPLKGTSNDLIDMKKVGSADPRFSTRETQKPTPKTPTVHTTPLLSGTTTKIIRMETEGEIDVVTID